MWQKGNKVKSSVRSKMKRSANIGTATEAMLELATLLFLNSLAEEARTRAFEERSATIRPEHVKHVSKKLLKKARG